MYSPSARPIITRDFANRYHMLRWSFEFLIRWRIFVLAITIVYKFKQ